MVRVLCVHGIGQQRKGEDILRAEWAQAMRDGMRRSGSPEADLPREVDIRCVFYGELFRPAGRLLGPDDPWLTAEDTTEFDQELLANWWRGAAETVATPAQPHAPRW